MIPLNIEPQNLSQPGLDVLQFSLMGMGLVFGCLLIIAIYITLLPRLLKTSNPKPKPSKKQPATDNGEEEETLLAIATAFHLHNNPPDGDDCITWKGHEDTESPWLVSGRMHSLTSRKATNTWNRR